MALQVTSSFTSINTISIGDPLRSSDFNNYINNETHFNSRLNNLGIGYISGCQIRNSGTSETVALIVDPGVLADSTGAVQISFAATLTGRINTTGAGGIDTGSVTSGSIYSVWVIMTDARQNSGIVGLESNEILFSRDATAPTMPPLFSYRRRIGWVATETQGAATIGIIQFRQIGIGKERYYKYPQGQQFFTTSGAAIALTTITASNFVPTGNRLSKMRLRVNSQASDDSFRSRVMNFLDQQPIIKYRQIAPIQASQSVFTFWQPFRDQWIEYRMESNTIGVTLDILGYWDYL